MQLVLYFQDIDKHYPNYPLDYFHGWKQACPQRITFLPSLSLFSPFPKMLPKMLLMGVSFPQGVEFWEAFQAVAASKQAKKKIII